jgi:fibronectin type 3 domain-containing protein
VNGRFLALLSFLTALTGCGYVGPVVPPSPQLPAAVTDLSVIERGDQLMITFTTPARTTDNLAIKEFNQIDLRIGPATTPFDFDRWASGAKGYDVALPAPNDPEDPKPDSLAESIAAKEWMGQHVAVAVRTSVKHKDHFSQWSNIVRLDVIPPLSPPTLRAVSKSEGVRLSWTAGEVGSSYRVLRRGGADKDASEIANVARPEFVDTNAQYDTRYEYQVVRKRGAAESLPSKPVPVTPVDTFSPSVPTGVTALPTPTGIEISWQRSPESDTRGYYVYRSISGGAFERLSGLINVPTFSDHQVEHGKTYSYAVSAVDQKGNESDRSTPERVSF